GRHAELRRPDVIEGSRRLTQVTSATGCERELEAGIARWYGAAANAGGIPHSWRHKGAARQHSRVVWQSRICRISGKVERHYMSSGGKRAAIQIDVVSERIPIVQDGIGSLLHGCFNQ